MPLITHDRPDPRFYINIVQGDDGNWSSDQMPLDDVVTNLPMIGDVYSKGLRSVTKDYVESFSAQSVLVNAPADMQRNSLYIVAQGSATPGYASAKACLDWINAMNAYRETLKTQIDSMTFDQLVVYSVPSAAWPPVPPNMPTATASAEGGVQMSRLVRKP